MWLVINQALLTNNSRFRRGLAVNNLCSVCGIYLETMLHALRDCFKGKETWLSVGHSFIKNSFFQHPLQNRLEKSTLDEARTYQGMDWPLIFITTCNLLWYCRNLFVFENQTNAHPFLACRVMVLAKDYNQNLCPTRKAKDAIPSISIKQIVWKPPPPPPTLDKGEHRWLAVGRSWNCYMWWYFR